MAQIYSTGAVDVWVKFPMDSRPQFLGHGERAPVINVTPRYSPFYATVSGPDIPLELLYTGSSGRVSIDLSRFNMNVLRAVQSRCRNGSFFPAIDPGLDDAGQIGTPLISSGCVPKLYLRFPSSGKPPYQNFVNGNLPDGYRFFAAILDPECVKPGGTTANYKISLVWNCLRAFDLNAETNYGWGKFRLYDQDMKDLAGLSPG